MQAKMLVMALALLVSVPMAAPAFAQSAPVAAPTAPVNVGSRRPGARARRPRRVRRALQPIMSRPPMSRSSAC